MAKALIWSTIIGILAFLLSMTFLKFRGTLGSIKLGSYGPFETISFFVNIIVAVVSIASLYIALAAYLDAQESGKEQKEALEASRKALESSVAIAQTQQNLLNENLKISKEHFDLVQEQWQSEKERLSRKPDIKVSLGEISAERLSSAEPIHITANDTGYNEFDYLVTNIGKVSVNKPTIVIVSSNANVQIEKRSFHFDRPNRNRLQFSNSELNDLTPSAESGGGHTIPVDIKVPADVKEFDLTFKIFGENLPSKQITSKIIVQNH